MVLFSNVPRGRIAYSQEHKLKTINSDAKLVGANRVCEGDSKYSMLSRFRLNSHRNPTTGF